VTDDGGWKLELGEWYVMSRSTGSLWAGPFPDEADAQGWLDVFKHRETLPFFVAQVVAYDDLVAADA